MKLPVNYFLLFTVILCVQCSSNPISEWKSINLLEYGVPIEIKAPENVKVEAGDLMGMKDITVQDSGKYNLQIFVSDAQLESLDESLSDLKELIKENPTFDKIIDSFPHGFLFRLQVDSTTQSYDFRYLVTRGNKQIQFQMGMGRIYKREDVKRTLKGIKTMEE